MFQKDLLPRSALTIFLFFAWAISAVSAAPKVVTSIKPVHSLVAGVMEGVGVPVLIIDGAQSPHTFSLKPGMASALQQSNVIFWLGPQLETSLEKPIETIAASSTRVELLKSKGIQGFGVVEEEGHDDHAHEQGADKDKDEHHETHQDEEEHKRHAHNGHGHGHGENAPDPHVWLDPGNAIAMTRAIAAALSKADSENVQAYKKNAERLIGELEKLGAEIDAKVASIKDQPFVVFHNAYGHFERRFGVKKPLVVTHNPAVAPGAKRLRALQEQIKLAGVRCVFVEPQFNANFVRALEDTKALNVATLDPLGQVADAGPRHYFVVLNNIADTLVECLSRAD